MMHFTFSMYDEEDKREVRVSQGDIEFLGDLLELFLSFAKACGYTYVQGIGADKGMEEEVWTVR